MGVLNTWQEFTAGARPQGGSIPELLIGEICQHRVNSGKADIG